MSARLAVPLFYHEKFKEARAISFLDICFYDLSLGINNFSRVEENRWKFAAPKKGITGEILILCHCKIWSLAEALMYL